MGSKEGRSNQLAVSCAGADADMVCPLFRDILERRYPDITLRDADPKAFLQISLNILAADKQGLTAQLSHQNASTARVTGPVRSYDVMDRSMDSTLLVRFLNQLLDEEAVSF